METDHLGVGISPGLRWEGWRDSGWAAAMRGASAGPAQGQHRCAAVRGPFPTLQPGTDAL